MEQAKILPLRTRVGGHVPSVVVTASTDVRALIPGASEVSSAIRFADDVWDLVGHPSWRSKAGAQTTLSFSDVPVHWRDAVKEWVLLCLAPSLATSWAPSDPVACSWPLTQEPVKLVTVQSNLKALRLALRLLDKYGLAELEMDEWARAAMLLRHPVDRSDKLENAELSPATLRMRAQQLHSLWTVRSIVGRPALLGSEPFGGLESTEVFGSGSRPKRNQRRPHEDVGLCLGYAAWVFDHIADDVMAHLRWWAEHAGKPGDAPGSREEGYEAMVGVLHEIAATQGVLPANRNTGGNLTLAHAALGRYIGLHNADEAYLWGRFAMRRFGDVPLALDGGNPCPLPITELPNLTTGGTTRWIPRLLNVDDELLWWASALVYYGMFYIAATCGLRDLDLDCLPVGCVVSETRTRPTGETYVRHSLRGYKQKNRAAPTPTTWPVNARVARIVTTLTELHHIYGLEPSINSHTGEGRLFHAGLITASNRGGRDSVHLDLQFMDWFRRGARALHVRGVIPRSLDHVGRLSSAQIRITALQAYASRQLGNALVAQFGQWSTKSVALGYHSDVTKIIHLADPGDALELEREHAGRTIELASRDLERMKGNGLPALAEVIRRDQATLSNPTPLSQSRLRSLGKKHPNLKTGPYSLCLYKPETALCGGGGAADFRLCRPYECRNSVMTIGQRATVELRRRQDLRMSPILRRDAEKIAAGMPQIVEEFADSSDEDLAQIIARERDAYVAVSLNEEDVDG